MKLMGEPETSSQESVEEGGSSHQRTPRQQNFVGLSSYSVGKR